MKNVAVSADPGSCAPAPPARSLLILLSVLTAMGAAPWLTDGCREHSPPPWQQGVDPNTAPWWELSLLPRLGPGVAHEIIRQRELHEGDGPCRFQIQPDLLTIRGIGAKTLLRVGPHLRFDACDVRRHAGQPGISP